MLDIRWLTRLKWRVTYRFLFRGELKTCKDIGECFKSSVFELQWLWYVLNSWFSLIPNFLSYISVHYFRVLFKNRHKLNMWLWERSSKSTSSLFVVPAAFFAFAFARRSWFFDFIFPFALIVEFPFTTAVIVAVAIPKRNWRETEEWAARPKMVV